MSTTAKPDAATAPTERVSDARRRAEAARAALDLVEAEVAAAEAEATAAQARTRLSELRNSSAQGDEKQSGATVVVDESVKDKAVKPDSDTAPSPRQIVHEPVDVSDGDRPRPGRRPARLLAVGVGKLRAWWRPWAVSVIVLIVAAAALAVVSIEQRSDHRGTIATRDHDLQIVDTAREGVRAMLSVDQNSVDADVEKILDGATGEWKADFSQRSAAFATVVRDANVTTVGKIDNAGIEKRNADGSYSVLVAASSQVTNAAGAQDEPRKWRLRVTVKPTAQGDKIAKMEFVP
ncbi:hypothetical protein [Williamsia sp. DF01-3]|uniref:hypothetical protein n=1 Tax=Williamsia sp. DF01-3 TaxID=2934157 RepID=UPI001FF53643|nr:hypothetical protein [Williamsia sp. DF01-3]MCK0516763.1 hypothetical protein [Williamsia sp. DF01-3]